jgi:hypothetical protein
MNKQPDSRPKKMSDDDALVAGIKIQNEKYEKLLSFVRCMAQQLHDDQAINLLKEIGEE